MKVQESDPGCSFCGVRIRNYCGPDQLCPACTYAIEGDRPRHGNYWAATIPQSTDALTDDQCRTVLNLYLRLLFGRRKSGS